MHYYTYKEGQEFGRGPRHHMSGLWFCFCNSHCSAFHVFIYNLSLTASTCTRSKLTFRLLSIEHLSISMTLSYKLRKSFYTNHPETTSVFQI